MEHPNSCHDPTSATASVDILEPRHVARRALGYIPRPCLAARAYSVFIYATSARFSSSSSFEPQHEVEELDRVLQRQAAAVVQVGRRSLMPRSVKVLIGPSGRRPLIDLGLEKRSSVQVVHLVVDEAGPEWHRAHCALPKNSFSPASSCSRRLGGIEPAGRIELRRGREVEHVLHLRHVATWIVRFGQVDALLIALARGRR